MDELPEALGAYFWGGYDVVNALVPGLQRIQQAGFGSTARIRITPAVRPTSATDRGEYRFDRAWEAEVPVSAPFLPAAVRSTQYRTAFSLPGLKTFVLTAYDSATTGASGNELHWDHPDWFDEHADVIRSEYRDMTLALFQTQNGRQVQFIVCNWETDSELFFQDPPYEASAARCASFTKWFTLRQEGIRQGREIAALNGWRGVTVNDAIEFNTFRFVPERAACAGVVVGTTLERIISTVKPDYASFSAWESTGRCRLYDDLEVLKQRLDVLTGGATQLIIGELGVSAHALAGRDTQQHKAWKYVKQVHAALRAEIPIIILWKAWDWFGQFEGEGIFQSSGRPRQVLLDLIDSFGASVAIHGVVDQFDMYGFRSPDGHRTYEVYGAFPGARPGNQMEPSWSGNYDAIVEFREGPVLVETWGEDASQINLSLPPHESEVRNFTLRLRRRRDGRTSSEFGPIRLNRMPGEADNCDAQVQQRYYDYWLDSPESTVGK